MKICHVNLASGYHGGENQTLLLIKQQIAMGYDLTVVANPKSPFAKAIQELPCDLVLASHYFQAHQRATTQGCDVIHVHEGKAIYWAYLQSKFFSIPYIVTRRIDNPLKKKWLANIAYQHAYAAIGLSNQIVQRINEAYPSLTTYKIPSSPVKYPVNSEQIAQIHQQFKHHFLVIHAANMVKHKGFDVTIEAARRLSHTHPEIQFALLGDGKERHNLEQLACHLTNVHFMGQQNAMGNWFAAANLQIHPSYTEGLGSVILEGMGSGLPVIASRTGGIPDIIEHKKNGLLIEPGDSAALADAIVHLASSREKRENLIHNGYEKLQQFKIDYTSILYADIYKKAIQ